MGIELSDPEAKKITVSPESFYLLGRRSQRIGAGGQIADRLFVGRFAMLNWSERFLEIEFTPRRPPGELSFDGESMMDVLKRIQEQHLAAGAK